VGPGRISSRKRVAISRAFARRFFVFSESIQEQQVVRSEMSFHSEMTELHFAGYPQETPPFVQSLRTIHISYQRGQVSPNRFHRATERRHPYSLSDGCKGMASLPTLSFLSVKKAANVSTLSQRY